MDKATKREALFYLPPTAYFIALVAKYLGLSIYGAWAAIVEIPTFVTLGGSTFATVWGSLVAVAALVALFGVFRTWLFQEWGMEAVGSFAFFSIFIGYSGALLYRAIDLGDASTGPLSVIPAVVSVMPAIRFMLLIRRRKA